MNIAKLAAWITNNRRFIIASVLVITGFLGYQLKNIQVDSDIISSLPDSDPHAILLKQMSEKFGGNKMGIVILEAEDLYTTEVLLHIRQITDSLSQMDGISSVTSLTNILDIRGSELGIEVGKLVDEWDLPESVEDLALLKQRVLSKDMYKGTIVAEDGTSTIIIFTIPDEIDIHAISAKVRSAVEELDLPENIYFTGAPMLVSSISDLISKDMARLIPITFLVIALVLYFGFKSISGIILPLAVAGISIIWTIGIMALGGFKMSMISSNIPILLVAIGSAYSIHVVNRINQAKNTDMIAAVRSSLEYILIPVFLAAVTTAIGFISFIFGSYLEMIRDYGLFTALGTMISSFLSLFFVPAILSFGKVRNQKSTALFGAGRFLNQFRSILLKHPKQIIFAWIFIVSIGILGASFIKREVDIKNYFQKENPTRKAEEIMTDKFGGTKPVFVHFIGNMQSPEVLKKMTETEDYMKQSPDIQRTQSIAGLIRQLTEALGEGYTIPDDAAKIEQLWFLLDGNEYLDRFVTPELDEGIIISNFISPDNQSKELFGVYMNDFIKKNSTPECRIEITGMPFVDVTMDQSLIKSQIGSLLIAIVFVVIIVGLILRSFSSGILAAIPIICAIIILFGFMGFMGIPLNIGTVLVASVALGIGIDYSIHIITHFNHEYKSGKQTYEALEETIRVSGKAILINVISVSAGFLVLLFSEMVPLQYFGLLVAISMVGSSLGALTLLPAILILRNIESTQN